MHVEHYADDAVARIAAAIGEKARARILYRLMDLVLIDGNPAARIADIRKVKIVFKDGVGYAPGTLLDSVHGAARIH
jgi:hypothetical protein